MLIICCTHPVDQVDILHLWLHSSKLTPWLRLLLCSCGVNMIVCWYLDSIITTVDGRVVVSKISEKVLLIIVGSVSLKLYYAIYLYFIGEGKPMAL